MGRRDPGSGIWETSLRWKSQSAERATFFAPRLPAWRAKYFKPVALPCHPRCVHAEPIFNSTQMERKRVTTPFSKLQHADHQLLPKLWCRRSVKVLLSPGLTGCLNTKYRFKLCPFYEKIRLSRLAVPLLPGPRNWQFQASLSGLAA